MTLQMSTVSTTQVSKVTRFSNPCDACGVDCTHGGIRKADVRITLSTSLLSIELCRSHWLMHKDALPKNTTVKAL